MAILGVLLGITMTVLAGCIWFGVREYPLLIKAEESLSERIAILERRKAVITEAATVQPKPARVAARQWSEDVPAAETK